MSRDLSFDVTLTKVSPRGTGAAGMWVAGTVAGHSFDALVFSEHADCSDYELGTSKISKLLVRRLADNKTVFNFDRGLDVAAANLAAGRVVEFLEDGLADFAFAQVLRKGHKRAAVAPASKGPRSFLTPIEAIEFAHRNAPVAIRLEGACLVVTREVADGMEAAGCEFAYLSEVNGRLVSTPVAGY